MRKIAFTLVLISSLAACNSNTKGWSSKDNDEFNTTCVQGSKAAMNESQAKDYCSCMLKKIQKDYSPEQAANIPDEKMTTMAKDCLGMK